MGFLSGLGKILSIAGPIAAAPFTGGTSLFGLAGVPAGAAAALGSGLGAVGSFLGKNGEAIGTAGRIVTGAAQGAQENRQNEIDNLIRQQLMRQGDARFVADDAFRRGAYQGDDAFRRGAYQGDDAFRRGAYQGDDTFRRAVFGHQQQQDLLQRPSTFARQALTGGLMGTLQDVTIDRPAGSTIPTFAVTGGLRPSAMGPDARAAGTLLAQGALGNLRSGGPAPIQPGPAPDFGPATDFGPAPTLGPGYQPPPDPHLPINAGTGEKLLGGIGLGTSILGGLGGFLGGLLDRPTLSTTPTRDRLAPSPLVTFPQRGGGLIEPLPTMASPQMLLQAPTVLQKRPLIGRG